MTKLLTLVSILFVFLQYGCSSPQKVEQNEPSLKIGSKAPILSCTTTVKGLLPEKTEGKVFVIEFWATWCGPCITSIPHLSEIQDKYNKSVIVIGIAASEQSTSTKIDNRLSNLEKFIDNQGNKIRYVLFYDDGNSKSFIEWMTASGHGGLPTAFIVGRDGKIKWIGHPDGSEFDTELEKAVTESSVSK